MQNVFLVHWKEAELAAFSEPLRDAGWRVDTAHADVLTAVHGIRDTAPDVVVLSLRRDPAKSRELAATMAAEDDLRALPVVLVDADEETTHMLAGELPQVTSCGWEELAAHLVDRLG